MAGLLMTITDAGLDALVDAQEGGADEILIDALGLSATPFTAAPTLEALPGQFKTLDAVSGETVADNIIHLTAYDVTDETYDVTGFGLFLDDGTLFAVYSAETEPVLTKAALAYALFSQDISFDNSVAANITFGNNLFSYPPATEDIKGVAKLSTEALADAGEDDETIMTPALVKRLLDAAIAAATDPAGTVKMWAGSLGEIQAGWALCDGTAGTPDLRDKFIIGAGSTYDIDDTGGSDTHGHGGSVADHALTEAQIPAHRHFVAVVGEGSAALTGANSISDITRVNENQEYDLQSKAGEPSIGRTSATGGGAAHNHGLTINDATTLPPYFALAFIIKT